MPAVGSFDAGSARARDVSVAEGSFVGFAEKRWSVGETALNVLVGVD
jgi:hypothetical protein